jgi:hypothetical protein
MNPQALNEAKFFMASVRNGSQSIDQARQEIGNHNEHRRNVRLCPRSEVYGVPEAQTPAH